MAGNIYDDQNRDPKEKFDALVDQNFKPGEEDQMEAAASEGAKQDRQDLKTAEEAGATDAPGKKHTGQLTPEQAKQLEENVGLYNPGELKRLRGLKLFEKHRKGIIAGGAAGGLALVLISIVFFIFPNFRIPSAMSLITGVVGEAAEEIVENRAQRFVIGYLIEKAGGNTDNYVIQGGLLDTLWATFRTGRLEEKIKQQTGIEIQRVGDGTIRVVHDGRPLEDINCRGMGAKRCVDTVTTLLSQDRLAAEDLRKIVRLTVPAWRFQKASKFARYLRIKYHVPRFGTPEKDSAKTNQENIETLRTQQVDLVLNNTLPSVDDAITCTTEDKQCERFNENNEPLDTTKPAGGEGNRAAANQVAGDLKEASNGASQDVVQNGGSLVERITERLLEKLVGTGTAKVATKAIPVVGWIDLASVINHMTIVATTNQVAARIPSILAAAATGAMYAQWQGYDDEIKAGLMDSLFVEVLTTQMNGSGNSTAPNACSYEFAAGENKPNVAECLQVDPRINDNLKSPRDELMADIIGVKRWVDPLEWWYYSVGFLFRGLESFLAWIISPLTSIAIEQFERLMSAVFGEDWQKDLMGSIVESMLKLFGLSIDPLATGAQLFNQLYAGADVAYNSYCSTNLGCRALTQVHDNNFFCVPVDVFETNDTIGCNGATHSSNRSDMEILPLNERLFSLEEPHSLFNEFVRSAPASKNPVVWVSASLRQIASLPANLLTTFNSKTYADSATPEEKAAIAGVRQYGATVQDLDQDIAQQVRQQQTPECPANDPENMFNICQADKEIAGSLMCVYSDCPEFQSGGLYRPNENQNLFANFKLWPGSAAARAGGW